MLSNNMYVACDRQRLNTVFRSQFDPNYNGEVSLDSTLKGRFFYFFVMHYSMCRYMIISKFGSLCLRSEGQNN